MVLLIVTLILLITLYLIRIRVELSAELSRGPESAPVHLEVRGPLFKFSRRADLVESLETAVDHIVARWKGTGEPVSPSVQKTVKRIPRKELKESAGPPLRYLGHRMQFTIDLSARVGGDDAAESAILAGLTWSVLGSGLGVASQWVPSILRTPRIRVIPDYEKPALQFDLHCIARFRAVHAIIMAVWLSLRVARRPEVLAWFRDSLRRKGDTGKNGTPNPGPDENGHGVD